MTRGVAILFSLYISSVLSREVVNFDFAWKYNVYPQLQCTDAAFLYNVSDLVCYGLQDIRASTPDLCRDACCAQSTCEIWQFTYGTKGLPCKVGISNNCTSTKLKVIGQRRNAVGDLSPKASTTPETLKSYNDKSWNIVDVPHDSILTQSFSPLNELLSAFLPKNQTWYRKHFNLPTEWKGLSIWLYFKGIFRASSIYLNGNFLKFHESGYTSFTVRLDNASNLTFGEGVKNENVIAIRCLASGNYGWWYEGSGIYRHVHLVAANRSHFMPDGIYVTSSITGPITPHVKNTLNRGVYAAKVAFNFKATIVNDNKTGNVSVFARFTIYNDMGGKVAANDSAKAYSTGIEALEVQAKVDVMKAELWSTVRPYLYTVQVDLMSGSVVYDSVNMSIGARNSAWNSNTGFSLNGMHVSWQGFNNHNHFAGLGIALSDRVALYQVQSMRAIGGNAWRTSYNPPSPVLLDITDRLGVMVWDETREFGKNKEWLDDFEDLIQRDRNHPSVMVWSICNGAECNIDDWYNISQSFKSVSKNADPLRPVSANMLMNNNSNLLDIEGFSHAVGPSFDLRHKLFPKKPLIGSECCSCPSQRGEDDRSLVSFGGFNANCLQQQSQYQLTRKFVAGCLVYTLFDHFGESDIFHKWPRVSTSFGAFDIAGFPKSSAYWFKLWWLLNIQNTPATKSNVPLDLPSLIDPIPDPASEDSTAGVLIHVVQHWDEAPNSAKHTIHVYTNAPQAELEINGKSMGVRQITSQGWAQWQGIIYIPGTLKAYALNVRGEVVATRTIQTAEIATKLVMGIDAPNETTGTGSSLVLDGQDMALIHAAIVDSKGYLVNLATNNVTFKVISGPGRIVGVGNGNPACVEPIRVTWRSAYHGLVRAVVQVTVNQALPPLHRKRLLQIDADGGAHTTVIPPGQETVNENIVIEASSEGLTSAQVSIPVSSDMAASANNILQH